MSLQEDLELNLAPALRGIDRLGAELGSVGDRFGVSISRALDQLRTGTSVPVTADTTSIPPEVEGAVDAADTSTTVDVNDESLDDAKRKARELGTELDGVRKIAAAIGVGLGAREVLQFFRSSVDAASDLAESTNKVRAVFHDSADEILRFGETSATAVGLASQEALEAAGTFGNLFTSLGLGRRDAAGMSVELVKLAADLASFNNIPIDEALERLRSGLVGEVEPLRRLGVSFNAAQVEQKAMELGLQSANGELSEAAKVQARYALILDQTTNAQGDFAKTSDQLANTQRIIRAQFQELKVAVGNELLPEILGLARAGQAELLPTLQRIAVAMSRGLGATVSGVLPLLEVLATTLEAIPAPLLAGAIQATALSRGLQAVGVKAHPMLTTIAAVLPLLSSLDEGLASVVVTAITFGAVGQRIGGTTGAAIGAIGGIASAAAGADTQLGKSINSGLGFAAVGAQLGNTVFPGLGAGAGAAIGGIVGLATSFLGGGESAEEMTDRLEELGSEIEKLGSAKALNKFLESGDNAADLFLGHIENVRKELRLLAQTNPAAAGRVLTGLQDLRDSGIITRQEFEQLSAAVDRGTLAFQRRTANQREANTANQELAAGNAALGASEDALKLKIDAFVAGIQTTVPTLGAIFDEFQSSASSAFGNAGVSVAGFIGNLQSTVTGIVNWNATVFNLLSQGLTGLAALVQSQGPVIGGQLGTEINNATPQTRLAWEMQIRAGNQALDEGKTRAEALAKATATSVVKAIDKPRADGSARRAGKGTGTEFGDGITVGISGKIPAIEEAAREAVRRAEAAARAEADSQSPSRVFAALGEDLSLGLARGMMGETSSVIRAAEQIVRDAASASGIAVSGAGTGPGSGGTTSISFNVEVHGVTDRAQAESVGHGVVKGAISELGGVTRRRLKIGAVIG